MANRIQQGADGIDSDGRLFTVRPRYANAVSPDKRGTVSSIRYKLPKDSRDILPYVGDLKKGSGAYSALTDAVSDTGFINFMVQSVSYSIQEKSQIMHTFGGKEAVYFYGHAPIMVSLTGILVDDLDNDQMVKFLTLYRDYLRGSQASKDYCYVELGLNNATFTGAFMNVQIQQSADRDTDIQFTAQFLAREFVLSSTDNIFQNNDGTYVSPYVVRDPDPTLTKVDIQAIIDANNRAIALDPEYDFDEDTGASLNSKSDGWLGGLLPSSFGTLPTVSDLIGFSAGDVTDFFGDITATIDNVTAPFTDAISQIDDFAQDIIGLVESVESGLDSVLSEIDSVTNQVFDTIDSLGDVVTKITNFPNSISSKLGHAGSPGGSPLPVLGSPSLGGSEAASLLAVGSNTGATRGTPQGEAATLSLSASSNETASLTLGGNDEEDEPPGLTPEPPPGLTPSIKITRVGG